jgi:drug/metabolite transporter (DMT)-like permease
VQRPVAAVLFMLAATAAFAGMGAFVKVLREDGFSTLEVMVFRAAPGVPWLWYQLHRRGARLWPHAPHVIFLRVFFGGTAMWASFQAMRVLTLAQHNVLRLTMPVFVALLAPLLLREHPRRVVYGALVIALLGALVMIRPDRPSLEMPLVAGVLALTSALLGALAHICVRHATRFDAPETVVFHFMMFVSAASFAMGWIDGGFRTLPAGQPVLEVVAKVVAMGLIGALAQLLMTYAYGHAQAPEVVIVGYAGIPLSYLIDLLLWDAQASVSALLGAVLMVVAGVILMGLRPRP